MKYKVGDRVRIKTWEQMVSEFGIIENGMFEGDIETPNLCIFRKAMKPLCGTVQEIDQVHQNFKLYSITDYHWCISDSMISGLAEGKGVQKEDSEFRPAEKTNYDVHRELCIGLNDLYVSKNEDYGNSFAEGFKEYGLIMPIIRLEDKFRRFKQLVMSGEQKVKDESIEDTLLDLANYALMTVTEMRMNK